MHINPLSPVPIDSSRIDTAGLRLHGQSFNKQNGIFVPSRLIEGVDGVTTTQYLDKSGKFSTPSATGGAGWITALDLDFTAESSQTLTTDGNYTIGGLTWTKGGSTGDQVAMTLTNGTGLVIQPKVSTNYNGTTRTAPYIYTDLAALIPSYYIDTPIRLWCYISTDTISVTAQNAGVFLDNMSSSSSTVAQFVMYRSASGGTKSILAGTALASASLSTQQAASPLDNTDRVMVQQIPLGLWDNRSTTYVASNSPIWPALSSLRPSNRGGTAAGTLNTSTNNIIAGLPMKFGITAQQGAAANLFSATIARVRIDYRNPN